jgi:hypothetical protein
MSSMKQEKTTVSKRNHSIDVRREIWESGTMAIAIANMKRRGITKSHAVELSGVPYEIVDRMYRGDAPAGKGEKDD